MVDDSHFNMLSATVTRPGPYRGLGVAVTRTEKKNLSKEDEEGLLLGVRHYRYRDTKAGWGGGVGRAWW